MAAGSGASAEPGTRHCEAAQTESVAKIANFNAANNWGFAPTLTPQLPGDVFAPAIGPLVQQQQFQLIQRLFDLWSWQAFLAMNWPTDPSGASASSITGYSATYAPLWSAWHDAAEIYLPNGARPAACGQPTAALQASRPRNLAAFARRNVPAPPPAAAESRTATRVLLNVSAVGELLHGRAPAAPTKTRMNEIDQAFSGPLFDPTAILFVNATDLTYVGSPARPRLNQNVRREPLILRANAGECIKVTLTNDVSTNYADTPGYTGVNMIVEGYNQNDVKPSMEIGLHPQLVYYDVQRSDGSNVGMNPSFGKQTAAQGEKRTYYWYAGDVRGTTVTLGSAPTTVTKTSSTDTVVDVSKALAISYTGRTAAEMMNGTYSDTLTFTISAN